MILAFDVSGSMAADDLQPTRMEAAKARRATLSSASRRPCEIGVVAFSDSGLAVQAPTNDQAAVLAAIDRLATGARHVARLWHSDLAQQHLCRRSRAPKRTPLQQPHADATPSPTPVPPGTYTSAIIVLLTDGENTAPPDPVEAAQRSADRGVRIYPVGIGSTAGTTLEVEGFLVHTQLDEATLQQVAEMTDGVYFNAASEEDLQEVYTIIEPQLVIEPEQMEITALLAGASVLVWLIGGICSLLWFGRIP